MKRVGIIDNLQDLTKLSAVGFENVSAEQCMVATGGNTGNVAFVHAVKKLIGNPFERVEWGASPNEVREKVDHLVICCANQIGKHADLGVWAEKLENFGLPVTLIGLGAQSDRIGQIPEVPEGTVKFLHTVKDLTANGCTNISVRGEFTNEVLKKFDVLSLPLGCPSLHTSSVKNLGDMIFNGQQGRIISRVAVAAGNPWHGPSAFFERKLVEVVNKFRGEYIVQHPVAMLQFSFGEAENISEKARNRFIEVYGSVEFEDLIEWYRKYSSVYVDPSVWLRSLERFDVALGPRYHGVALAIQAGIPGCVITIDSRTEELCIGTGIKNIHFKDADALSAEELVEYSIWTESDVEKFDVNRKDKSRGYVEFLKANDLMCSNHLINLSS